MAGNGIRGRGTRKAVEKLPERADKLQPEHSMFAVCADPTDHMRIALVPGEPIPVAPLRMTVQSSQRFGPLTFA